MSKIMPKHRSGATNYSQRLKAIRPYVSFNYDLRQPLTSGAKRRINDYYEYIQKLTIRPHQVYRARSEDVLRSVQRFAQHDKRHKFLKVAFVVNAGSERMKIRIGKDGRVRGRTGNISLFEIPIDAATVARLAADDDEQDDPEVNSVREYIAALIDDAPEAKRYVPQAGAFEVPGSYHRKFIVDEVVKLMGRYGADKNDPDDRNSHYWGNWLFGINGYNFHEQADIGAYREARRQAAKKKAREYVTQRRRENRQSTREPDYWLNDEKAQAKRGYPPQPAGWRKVGSREYFRHVYKLGYTEI